MTEKPKRSKVKFIATFCVAMILLALTRHVFSIDIPMRQFDNDKLATVSYTLSAPEEVYIGDSSDLDIPYEEEPMVIDSIELDKTLDKEIEDVTDVEDTLPNADTTDDEDSSEVDIQDADDNQEISNQPADDTKNTRRSKRTKVRGVWSFDKCFPDINDVQLVAARKNGIRPVKNRQDAEKLAKAHKLVNITHSPFYTVDELTHSMPYLVPKAQQLLNTICINFIDSLAAHGLDPCIPMVTSALRTTDDVASLQRGNGNATTNSCHCYGTTVDITYVRFAPIIGRYDKSVPLNRWDFTYKQVLSEVLDDLRSRGLCYVKYERKQGCYHLTVR